MRKWPPVRSRGTGTCTRGMIARNYGQGPHRTPCTVVSTARALPERTGRGRSGWSIHHPLVPLTSGSAVPAHRRNCRRPGQGSFPDAKGPGTSAPRSAAQAARPPQELRRHPAGIMRPAPSAALRPVLGTASLPGLHGAPRDFSRHCHLAFRLTEPPLGTAPGIHRRRNNPQSFLESSPLPVRKRDPRCPEMIETSNPLPQRRRAPPRPWPPSFFVTAVGSAHTHRVSNYHHRSNHPSSPSGDLHRHEVTANDNPATPTPHIDLDRCSERASEAAARAYDDEQDGM